MHSRARFSRAPHGLAIAVFGSHRQFALELDALHLFSPQEMLLVRRTFHHLREGPTVKESVLTNCLARGSSGTNWCRTLLAASRPVQQVHGRHRAGAIQEVSTTPPQWTCAQRAGRVGSLAGIRMLFDWLVIGQQLAVSRLSTCQRGCDERSDGSGAVTDSMAWALRWPRCFALHPEEPLGSSARSLWPWHSSHPG